MKLKVSLKFAADKIVPMGTLASHGRDSLFEYASDFAARGLNPAPFRLPVAPGVKAYDFSGNMETFGIFEDSLPDGWGRRLIDSTFRKAHGRLPTVMERLAVVGSSGSGALIYEPEEKLEDEKSDFDLTRMASGAMDFDAGIIEEVLPEVRKAGGSSGGARPKAFIGFNPSTHEVCPESEALHEGFEHWIVKFNTRRDGVESGRLEYDYYKRALDAGVNMSPSCLIKTKVGDFFATKRFDRTDKGGRLHMASAAGLLHADFRVPGDEYELLFKLCEVLTRNLADKEELFRRVELNVRHQNKDDHLKNFAFLMDERGEWRLAPFYDFTRSEGPNGWHTLSIAGEGLNPSEDDLKRLAERVGLA